MIFSYSSENFILIFYMLFANKVKYKNISPVAFATTKTIHIAYTIFNSKRDICLGH